MKEDLSHAVVYEVKLIGMLLSNWNYLGGGARKVQCACPSLYGSYHMLSAAY